MSAQPSTARSSACRNHNGIDIRGADNSIGGQTAAARNLVSDNSGNGIFVNTGPGGNNMEGNSSARVKGLRSSNMRDGIAVLNSPNNTIGGTNVNARNVIASNFDNGIVLASFPKFGVATGNIVQGNFVGTDVTGTVDLGNGDHGMVLFRATGNTIGGTAAGAGNVFFGNTFHGILLLETPTATRSKAMSFRRTARPASTLSSPTTTSCRATFSARTRPGRSIKGTASPAC